MEPESVAVARGGTGVSPVCREAAWGAMSVKAVDHRRDACATGATRGRVRQISGTLGTFLMGQGLVQVLTLATGLLLVRWMAVEEFAMYRSAFAFQFIMGALVDLGLSGSIVAMIGSRRDDPAVVGGSSMQPRGTVIGCSW